MSKRNTSRIDAIVTPGKDGEGEIDFYVRPDTSEGSWLDRMFYGFWD